MQENEVRLIARSMLSKDAYDEEVTERLVRTVETRTSWIFLTGKYAYKIRKPVNLGFADSTTIEKRRRLLELEFSAGRKTCPGLHVAVLPVNDLQGKLRVSGQGKTVDYALKMAQVPQELMLPELISAGKIDEPVMDALARKLSDLHKGAERGGEVSEFGRFENFMQTFEENLQDLRQFVPSMLTEQELEEIATPMRRFADKRKPMFARRLSEERVRRIHGDLHAGNVIMAADGPLIIGSVVHNMKLSCADTIYDAALFSSDMETRGRTGLAKAFVEKYTWYSGDDDLTVLLPFYKAYGSVARAKASAERILDKPGAMEESRASFEARKHIDAALRYAGSLR